MIKYKPGVLSRARRGRVTVGVHPAIWRVLDIAEPIWSTLGLDLWVTSLLDSEHRAGSLHYVGLAVDLRSRDLPGDTLARVAADLRIGLGPDYDVVIEPDHIHVEYQPKEPWT